MQMVKYFEDYNLFELAEKTIPLIHDNTNLEVQKMQARISFHRGNVHDSL